MAWEPTPWETKPVVKENDEVITQHWAIATFHFTPTLMSISDLEALPDTTWLSLSWNTNLPTIRDELNKYPEVYYATFRDSWNLYTYMWCNNALWDWTNPHEWVYVVETMWRDIYFHFVYFDENTRKRVSTAKTRSLSTDV